MRLAVGLRVAVAAVAVEHVDERFKGGQRLLQRLGADQVEVGSRILTQLSSGEVVSRVEEINARSEGQQDSQPEEE